MIELELNDDLLSDIIDYAKTKGYSYGTLKGYAIQLKALFKKYDKLDKDNMIKILKKAKHPYHRAILSLINEYCFYSKVDFNMTIPKKRNPPRKIPETLTIEEIKKMIEATPKPYNLMLRCIFGIGAGLRISEAIKLSWNHFYWADWLKTKEDGIAIIKESKRGKSRIVNVPKNLMQDLYNYAKDEELLNEFFIPEKGVLFNFGIGEWNKTTFSYNKELWKNEYVKHAYDWFRYNIIRQICEKVVGRNIKVHSLRHSRATYLLEVEEIPLERISQLLGHSDIKTTMIYAKMNPNKTMAMMKGVKSI